MAKVNAKGVGLSVLAIETATHRTKRTLQPLRLVGAKQNHACGAAV